MSTTHYDWRKITGVINTTGASGSLDLIEGMAEEIRQIVVTPAVSNNMYTIRMENKDDSDMPMFIRPAEGTYNEIVDLPVYGYYKLVIEGASSDDTFKIRILYK